MKTLLKPLTTLIDRLVWMVGWFAILRYALEHWPVAYAITGGTILAGFGVWYSWRFFVQPFRAGLRGE